MSFKDNLGAIPENSGHDTFHDVFSIGASAEGAARLKELVAKYPVFTGMIDAFGEHARSDEARGADVAELNAISMGMGMVLGALALIAESEIPNANPDH
jgi:hypothetical protein